MPLPRLRRWLGWLEEMRPCDPDCLIARLPGVWWENMGRECGRREALDCTTAMCRGRAPHRPTCIMQNCAVKSLGGSTFQPGPGRVGAWQYPLELVS
jgi:hypothetical protein